jgi:hypothetical protein
MSSANFVISPEETTAADGAGVTAALEAKRYFCRIAKAGVLPRHCSTPRGPAALQAAHHAE